MFVHAVYFWLRDDLTAAERQTYLEGVRSLTTIPDVRHGWVGTPAATDRPVIERGYSYALTVAFADEAAHDAYQVHPVHDRFREQFGGSWKRIVIYDALGA